MRPGAAGGVDQERRQREKHLHRPHVHDQARGRSDRGNIQDRGKGRRLHRARYAWTSDGAVAYPGAPESRARDAAARGRSRGSSLLLVGLRTGVQHESKLGQWLFVGNHSVRAEAAPRWCEGRDTPQDSRGQPEAFPGVRAEGIVKDATYLQVTSMPKKWRNTWRFGRFFAFCSGLRM